MSFVSDAIAKYAVGGDEDIAICVLPDASVIVASKKPANLSELPATVQRKLFAVASEIATLAYDAMQAHGTNVIGSDAGHAHYRVIARNEEDGLPLRWTPGKSSPGELASLAGKLKDAAWTIGKKDVTHVERPVIEEPKPAAITLAKHEPKKPEYKEREIEEPGMRAPGDHSGHDLSDVAAEMQRRTKPGPFEEADYRIKNLTRRR